MEPYAYLAGTVLFTVAAQSLVKWRVDAAGDLPGRLSERVSYLLDLLIDPWIITAGILVIIASASWIAALMHFELSRAYPFMATTFALVLVASAIFFAEPITLPKVLGITMIVAGLIIGHRS